MRGTRTRVMVAGTVERTVGRTRAVLLVQVEQLDAPIDASAPPTRETLRGAALSRREALDLLGCCDLCADVGIARPATSEARLSGGTWASLCDAHAYRARSARHLVIEAPDERSAA